MECVFVAELARSAQDEDVLALARHRDCLLLTEDADFGRLIFAEAAPPPPGVILVTMPRLAPALRAARVMVEAAPALGEAVGALVVIDTQGRRRRPFPAVTRA